MPVNLVLREVLAASSDLSSYLHDQTRKRRMPLETNETNSNSTQFVPESDETQTATVSRAEWEKAYYALPSGHVRVGLPGDIAVSALLDHGSEINLMPLRVFERLNWPIDMNIDWTINGYDPDIAKKAKAEGVLGVLHDIPLEIGGLVVKQQIFVVPRTGPGLILGRPFERSTRAQTINEDDGSVTVLLRSQDGSKELTFTSVKGQHERNREAVRFKDGYYVDHITVEEGTGQDSDKLALKG